MNNYKIDRKKWNDMDIFSQMGNIYIEASRAFKQKRADNLEYTNLSIARTIDLFDATVDNLIQKKSMKAKEVLRAKDQFLTILYSETFNQEDSLLLERYLMQFAIASRLRK